MKINILSIILLVFTVAFSACNLLDETSPNDIDAASAFKTAGDAENALLGLYSSLQNPNYYGGMYPLIADALGDNCTTGGFDNPLLNEIGAKTVTPSNTIVEDLWLSIYKTIANCNRLLEGLSRINDLDSDRRSQIEGQARAVRALAHFDLLRYFGYHWDAGSAYGIPVVKTVQGIGDIVPRSDVSASYNFITSELEVALNLVDSEDRSVQYINPASIHALLARVYLYKKDIAKAAENATAVIEDGTFTLLDRDNFSSVYSSRRTSESIFELAFDNQNRSDYNSLTYSRPDALRTELFFLASPSLAAFFAERQNDIRAAMQDYDPANQDESITSDGSGRTQKYRGETTKDNPAYILRLAEMYLIRAEAWGSADGLADLNFLRTIRGLAEISPADEAGYSQALFDERRAELNFEGHIYFDLARTGRTAEVLGDDFRGVLPIPLREITATNGIIEQNPGY
jgi:hypothetical protein